MKYNYEEDDKIIYLDDSVDVGKEPLPVPEELREWYERTIEEFDKKFKLGKYKSI